MDKDTRSEINRALAKAIAYRDCGKGAHAKAWAAELVRLLECEDILVLGAQRDLHRALELADAGAR